MTTPNPGSLNPGQWGVTGTGGSIPAKANQTQGNVTQTLQNQFSSDNFAGLGGGLIAMILSFIGAAIASILGGFLSVIDAIFGTVNDEYVRQIPTIMDHSNSIDTLVEQFNQLILQGNAIVFLSNNTYTPSPGIVSVDVIIIAAGAGGGSGRGDIVASNRTGGGGGGGGGEVHASIPASLLPTDGSGNFTGIPIVIGAGGPGGTSSGTPGTGGGNTSFGTGGYLITAGGGNGGASIGAQTGSPGGAGGVGMIPGGNGGQGAGTQTTMSTFGGSSTSQYDLYGGGGGGGGGATNVNPGSNGGAGGLAPGGTLGQPGSAPSSLIATGGGGGGGSLSDTSAGGAGAFPAGGGGGGGGSLGSAGNGGNGGNGIIYVIERMV
ncbi:hypothetical protein [Nocardia sp. NPDC019302]|uniref:glycine-rich domain-containing protein n=1 Tax=Nocardia sp. NPDC019302 TaxID=3154592 RepID=UPI0033D89ECD